MRLTAQIVSAHVSNNLVTPDQLPKLISDVHHALTTVGRTAAEQPKPEPADLITKSVFKDHIVCLDCGKHFSMLKRHLMADHKLTVDQYRQKWSLPQSYPVVSPNYAKTRSSVAKKIGLGRMGAAASRKSWTRVGRSDPSSVIFIHGPATRASTSVMQGWSRGTSLASLRQTAARRSCQSVAR
jgi:predicted transcriptional regulator